MCIRDRKKNAEGIIGPGVMSCSIAAQRDQICPLSRGASDVLLREGVLTEVVSPSKHIGELRLISEANVRYTIEDLLSDSPLVGKSAEGGRLV